MDASGAVEASARAMPVTSLFSSFASFSTGAGASEVSAGASVAAVSLTGSAFSVCVQRQLEYATAGDHDVPLGS